MSRVYKLFLFLLLATPLVAENKANFPADPPPAEQLKAARAQLALLQSQVRLLQAQNTALLAQIEAMKAGEQYRQVETELTGDAACRLTDTQTIQCPEEEVQDAKLDAAAAVDRPGE